MTKSGPVRVTADPAQPDVVAEDADAEGRRSPTRWWPTRRRWPPTSSARPRCCSTAATRTRSASKEANLGNLVADGFRAAANRTAAADGRPVANIAFSNGGGIRTSIAGRATSPRSSTFDVLPFDNVIVTVPNVTRAKLQGADGVGRRPRCPAANGKFPQISGFKMTVDTTKTAQVQDGSNVTTPGQRITSLTLDDGTKIVENGAVVAGAPSSTSPRRTSRPTTATTIRSRDCRRSPRACRTSSRCTTTSCSDLGGQVRAARYPAGGVRAHRHHPVSSPGTARRMRAVPDSLVAVV